VFNVLHKLTSEGAGTSQSADRRASFRFQYFSLRCMAVDVKSGPDDSFDAGAPGVLFNPRTSPLRTDTFDVAKDGRFLIPTLTQQSALPINVVVNWPAMLKK